MESMCGFVIQATADLLTKQNARFQYKEKPFYPTVQTYTPAVFFAGSKDEDLKHAIQVTTYQGSTQVTVAVYSVVLKCDDIPWLAMVIAEFNRQSEAGYFIYELTPGKLQFRYIVNLQLDRRKLQDKEYVQTIMWMTIEQADLRFREVGLSLLNRIKEEKTRKEEILAISNRQLEYYERVSAVMIKLGFAPYELEASSSAVLRMTAHKRHHTSFEPLTINNILVEWKHPIHTLRTCLSVNQPLLEEHQAFIYEEIARWNWEFTHQVCLFSGTTVSVSLQSVQFFLDEMMTVFESLVKELIELAELVLQDICCIRVTPVEELIHYHSLYLAKYRSKSNHSMQVLYAAKLSREELIAEREERRAILDTPCISHYFYFEGVEDWDNSSLTVRIPSHFRSISSFFEKDEIPHQSIAQCLCSLLQDLTAQGYYYQNLHELVYYTGQHTGPLLKVVPVNLAKNKLHGVNAEWINKINTYFASLFRQFSAVESAERVYSMVKKEGGPCIDPCYLTCPSICSHSVPQWWTQPHYLGRVRVSLTPVFREGLYRDFHEIMTEFLKAQKSYHPVFQLKPLGFVLLSDAKKVHTIFLVQETAKFENLYEFCKSCPGERSRLIDQLSTAVSFLHTREISPLVLSPAAISVDILPTGAVVKLPSLPLLSSRLIPAIVQYMPLDRPVTEDWRDVDNATLERLRVFLETGEEPREVRGSRMATDLAVVATADTVREWVHMYVKSS